MMEKVYFLMVVNKDYSLPNEALMSQLLPHLVPFGLCQQQ